MSVTSHPASEPLCSLATVLDAVSADVRALDAGAVLEEVVAHRRVAEQCEARVLALAVHYADLHPVTEEHAAATPAAGHRWLVDRESASDSAEPSLAGEGTPGIAEFAVGELAAVLGVPYGTAFGLVADSVGLCYRLPRLWERVHMGRLPAWRARIVARESVRLSRAAVDFVDRQVAILVDRRRPPSLGQLRDLVHEARLRVDPDLERGLEEAASAHRGVWFDHQTSTASAATTTMTAILDAWDALDLDARLSEVAADLRSVGDARPVEVRRSAALALLAHPQRVMDLGSAAVASDQAPPPVSPPPTTPAEAPRTAGSVINLYVHTNLSDLAPSALADPDHVATGAGAGKVTEDGYGLVERLGPVLLEQLRGWLCRTERIVVRPVLDPMEPDSVATRPVDRHDPPPAMRDLVMLRDGQCVFPGCQADARAGDVDHIDAYVDPGDGGPPGQTRPENLGCLCRRHHRLKTLTAWRYRRELNGSYAWTSPRGRSFVTHPLPRRGPRA